MGHKTWKWRTNGAQMAHKDGHETWQFKCGKYLTTSKSETIWLGFCIDRNDITKCFASTSITVTAKQNHAINRIGVPSVLNLDTTHGITNTGLHCKMCPHERLDGSSVVGWIPCWRCTTTRYCDLTVMATDLPRSCTEKLNIYIWTSTTSKRLYAYRLLA